MVSIPQTKDIEQWTGLKSKTLPFVAYEKWISLTKTNAGLGWKGGKTFSEEMDPERSWK
jgi:hypothetical protein